MDEQLKLEIAKFRFGIISDFITGVRFGRGERAKLMKEKTQRQWNIPGSTRSRISAGTIVMWIGKYRASGGKLESLMPLEREDKGCHKALDLAVRIALRDLKQKYPSDTLPTLVNRLRAAKVLAPDETINTATAYRFMSTIETTEQSDADRDRRKFEAEYPNALWQCDVCHGHVALNEKGVRKKVYLFAILDDHSRLIAHAEYMFHETTESLKRCLMQALAARGKPHKFYVDNGACYRSLSLENICARLGIVLVHARPYKPEGKGKVERWFRTTRDTFFPRVIEHETTLPELNAKLQDWIKEYNERAHSSLGCSPIEKYRQGLACVRPAPANLEDYFRESVTRVVRNDRTVQLQGLFLEVPSGLVGHKVELHFHPEAPQEAEVFLGKESHGKARLVDTAINNRVGRSWAKQSDQKESPQVQNPEATKVKDGELFNRQQLHGELQ